MTRAVSLATIIRYGRRRLEGSVIIVVFCCSILSTEWEIVRRLVLAVNAIYEHVRSKGVGGLVDTIETSTWKEVTCK